MAIKGKSRSRGAKAVARGPKPAYVPVKTPLVRRRGFQIAVGAVVGVAAIAGLWYGFAKQAREDRERDLQERLAAAVSEYGSPVEGALATVGQAVPPTGFQPFPDLAGVLDRLENGRRLDEATTTAEAVEESAGAAAETIEGVDVTEIVAEQGFERLFAVYLLSSQDGMVEGLGLYEQAASLVSLAAAAGEDERAELVASARSVLDLAERVFARGYADYVEAQAIAGALGAVGPGAIPGLTGPTG
ncbi:MAG TPA: hypothetical protein VF029_01700 [Actinomycetota bacterium]